MTFINKISKPISGILSVLILLSSLNFMIDLHYCQGNLKSFSIVGKAKNCHEMAKEMASCPHHKASQSPMACGDEDSNCCQNKAMFVDADVDEPIFFVNQLDLNLQKFVVAYVLTYYFNPLEITRKVTTFANYIPPLIPKDIAVLYETFLL